MSIRAAPDVTRQLLLVSRSCAIFVAMVGAAVLAGWALDLPAVKGLGPGWATMKANTAACFLLAGLALGSSHIHSASESARLLARYVQVTFAFMVVAMGILSLSEDMLGWDAGIDQLLFSDPKLTSSVGAPGRMSPATAFCFIVLGVSLALLAARGRAAAAAAQTLAAVAAVVATLALLGYWYSIPGLYRAQPLSSIALHTAASFLALSAGSLLARPDQGWIAVFFADATTATMGRRLVMATLVALPILGWIRLKGIELGWYGAELGLGLIIVASMVIVSMLVWLSTRTANAAEEKILHLNRLYAMLSHINQLVVRNIDRDQLLDNACGIAARHGRFPLAWIGLSGNGDGSLAIAAADGVAGVKPTKATLASLLPPGITGDVVARLTRGEQIIVNDIDRHGRSVFRHGAAPSGAMVSMAAFPVWMQGRVVGTFVFCSDETDFFDRDEIALLTEVTHDVSFALDQIEAEAKRRAAEKAVERALREKELLLGEIHHRVKNNLQLVHSLLDLHSARLQEPTVAEMLRASQNRIASMSLVHQMLYQSSDFARLDFGAFLHSLVSTLLEAYDVDRQRIGVAIDAENIPLPVDAAIPCGLLVTELITNAIKHAFPDGRRGTIKVELAKESDAALILAVSDNGVGVAQDAGLQKTDTLGLQLVNLLVDQLGGSLTVQRCGPTRFEVRFAVETEPEPAL